VKNFKQKVLSPKVYSKEFSSLSLHSKGFTKLYKIPPKLDPNPNTHSFPYLYRHQGISVSRMTLEIRSYLSINLPLFLALVYSIYPSAPPHM
jgi:hypothetical protein